MIDRALFLADLLTETRFDIDLWSSRAGLPVYITDALKPPFLSCVYNGRVYVRKSLNRTDKVLCIAHEDFHEHFHADCVAYTDLHVRQIEREESQCWLYSSLVLFPDLTTYDDYDHFRRTCGLPPPVADLRIYFNQLTEI